MSSRDGDRYEDVPLWTLHELSALAADADELAARLRRARLWLSQNAEGQRRSAPPRS